MTDGVLPHILNAASLHEGGRRNVQQLTDQLAGVEGDTRFERQIEEYYTSAETSRPISLSNPSVSAKRI